MSLRQTRIVSPLAGIKLQCTYSKDSVFSHGSRCLRVVLQNCHLGTFVAALPALTVTTPETSNILDGQPGVPVPATEGSAGDAGVDPVGLVGAGVLPLTRPSGAV